jgi:hypothetical protein
VPTVEEWRIKDCEEVDTVCFNTKTNENIREDSKFLVGIRSSYPIHLPAVMQYAITHSKNV